MNRGYYCSLRRLKFSDMVQLSFKNWVVIHNEIKLALQISTAFKFSVARNSNTCFSLLKSSVSVLDFSLRQPKSMGKTHTYLLQPKLLHPNVPQSCCSLGTTGFSGCDLTPLPPFLIPLQPLAIDTLVSQPCSLLCRGPQTF